MIDGRCAYCGNTTTTAGCVRLGCAGNPTMVYARPAPQADGFKPSAGSGMAAVERIAAIMRERGVADDVRLSEIQDVLTMAGHDVPLRGYTGTLVSAVGDRKVRRVLECVAVLMAAGTALLVWLLPPAGNRMAAGWLGGAVFVLSIAWIVLVSRRWIP